MGNVVPFALPPDDQPVEPVEFGSRWVPGLDTPLALALKPYPVNLYMVEGDSGSGIAGTLEPSGVFRPLPNVLVPQDSEYWCDMFVHPDTGKLAAGFVESTVVWNGCVAHSIKDGVDGDGDPCKVRGENGSLLGEWPIHAPRHDRAVNPVKARLAAELDAIEAARMASFKTEAA